ncbi:MAG: hypothetical protein EOO29_38565, partial [Comamonadaceae bacterium]
MSFLPTSMARTGAALALAAAFSVLGVAQAQQAAPAAAESPAVRTERSMSLRLANDIAAGTVAACAANGYAVTATVVDRAGVVRAVQRADNAGPH